MSHLPIEKLKALKVIVSHENCADGLASAMILKDVLPKAKVVFLQYGTPDHVNLVAEEGMIFCDFSPPPARAQEFVDVGAIVLDHHKTAKAVVALFGDLGVFADEKDDPGVSGAVLAYREVWLPLLTERPKADLPADQQNARTTIEAQLRTEMDNATSRLLKKGVTPEDAKTQVEADTEVAKLKEQLAFKATGPLVDRVSNFARLAGVRDTWQTENPDWSLAREQHEALMFYPQEMWLEAPIFHADNPFVWNSRLSLGKVLVAKFQRGVTKALDGAYRFTANGLSVALFQGASYTSDAAEIAGVDLVIGFAYFVEKQEDMAGWPAGTAKGPKLVVSCRSRGDFDASAFAKSLGGGGHTQAAGFSVNLKAADTNPYTFIEGLVKDYKP